MFLFALCIPYLVFSNPISFRTQINEELAESKLDFLLELNSIRIGLVEK